MARGVCSQVTYKSKRGSNSLEEYHLQLKKCIPGPHTSEARAEALRGETNERRNIKMGIRYRGESNLPLQSPAGSPCDPWWLFLGSPGERDYHTYDYRLLYVVRLLAARVGVDVMPDLREPDPGLDTGEHFGYVFADPPDPSAERGPAGDRKGEGGGDSKRRGKRSSAVPDIDQQVDAPEFLERLLEQARTTAERRAAMRGALRPQAPSQRHDRGPPPRPPTTRPPGAGEGSTLDAIRSDLLTRDENVLHPLSLMGRFVTVRVEDEPVARPRRELLELCWLALELGRYRLCVEWVPADGDCQFWCFSRAYPQLGDRHQIRAMVADQLEADEDLHAIAVAEAAGEGYVMDGQSVTNIAEYLR